MTILTAQGRRLMTVGALLAIAPDLAVSRRPFSTRPICWPGLGVTAAGLLLVDPALAFACGWLVELAADPTWATIRLPGGDDP
jgi:hypothetical protein